MLLLATLMTLLVPINGPICLIKPAPEVLTADQTRWNNAPVTRGWQWFTESHPAPIGDDARCNCINLTPGDWKVYQPGGMEK